MRQGTNLPRVLIERTVVEEFNVLLPYCRMRDAEPLPFYDALLRESYALICFASDLTTVEATGACTRTGR